MVGGPLSTGYRHKPRWIYAAAILFMLAPLGNFVATLAAMNVQDWYNPATWITWSRWISPSAWILMTLLFLAGVGLLFVRRLTWIFASVSLLLVVAFNVYYFLNHAAQPSGATNPVTLGSMIALTLLAALLLYRQQFRRPYLNPRVRWWETHPRYRADLGVRVPPFGERCVLLDISLSGALVDFPDRVPVMPEQIDLEVTADLKLPCQVVRRPDSGRAFGLAFLKTTRSQRSELRRFLSQIASDPTRFYR